jgi:tight adherence protein B
MSLLLLLGVASFCLAAGAAAAVFGVHSYLVAEAAPSPIQERLMRLSRPDLVNEKIEVVEPIQLLKESRYQYPEIQEWMQLWGPIKQLELLVMQAGVQQPIDLFLIQSLVFPCVALLVATLLHAWFWIFLSPVVFLAVWQWLRFKRAARFDKLVQQLPDMLGLLSSSIRAGYSFQAAMSLVAEEMPEPSKTELSQVVREINLGLPIKEALKRLTYQLGNLPDYQILTTAVTIQRETGGNLVEVLLQLSQTVRARFRLKGQVSSLTAQSRATGMLLGATPSIMLTALTLFFPSYVEPLYETPMGNLMLIGAVVLQVMGFFVIRQIIRIRF